MRFSLPGAFAPFLLLHAIASSHAATLTVGPGGHPTIAAAITAAQEGDIIEISSGTYSGDLTIDKTLALRGPNHGRAAGTNAATRLAEAVLSGGIRILAAAPDSEISGLIIQSGSASVDAEFAVRIEAAGVTLRDTILEEVSGAGPGVDGFAVIASASASAPIISGNLVFRNQHGILLQSAGTATVTGNLISGNSIGLDLDSQSSAVVTNNGFHSNSTAGIRAGGTTSGTSARLNVLRGNGTAVANASASPFDAARNFWDTGSQPPAAGGLNGLSGDVLFNPWYSDAALTTLVTGVFADTTVGPGETVETDFLRFAPGRKLVVNGGTLAVTRLEMEAGAVLEVNDGNLTLGLAGGGSHTIAGTFIVTHSLGSIEILGDTTFSGNTLALVSDFHIAPGVSLTVTGSLVLDGCHLDSLAVWNLVTTSSSSLEMIRCRVKNAAVVVGSADTRITSSSFPGSTVHVSAAGSGASVFHNEFPGGAGALTIQPGATATTSAEGWGNVSAAAGASNRMTLSLRPPALSGRTLAGDGTLYIRPGDPVVAGLVTANHLAPVQAAEALVAYHTGYLTFGQMTPDAAWENELFTGGEAGAVLGRVDAAVGLSFGIGDPDGTLADSTIGDFHFTAGAAEGRTMVFFRNPDGDDPVHSGTRLTASSGGVPSIIAEPFTTNAGEIVIDGSAPLIEPGATAAQSAVDVLQDGVFTRIGTVEVVLKAFDALAGIDEAGVTVSLDGPAVIQGTFASRGSEVLHGETYDRFTFQVPVTASTPDGTYTVTAMVADRSGNESSVTVGTLEVVRFIAQVTVSSDGIVSGVTRDVTFTGTDSAGAILFTLVQPVTFISGTGTATIGNLPAGLSHLSAKTAWTLRKKLPCAPDMAGNAAASFTGAAILRGGDLNNDNVVSLSDYNLLNARWLTLDAAADINGDGGVSLADFNLLNGNWLSAGDAP